MVEKNSDIFLLKLIYLWYWDKNNTDEDDDYSDLLDY